MRDRALDGEGAGAHCLRPGHVAAPDLSQAPQAARHGDRDRVAGIVVAHVGFLRVDHQPPVASGGRHVGEPELHDRPLRRDGPVVDVAVHVPQQQLGIEVLVADLADPADAPHSQRLDHRLQLAAGRRQDIPHVVAIAAPVDHARPDQLVQPLGQQGRRHPRDPAAQVVETLTAGDQLADDEQCPPLVEQLHRLGHRAELVIRGPHAASVSPGQRPRPDQIQMLY